MGAPQCGGQALIEGVMMRCPSGMTVAVRRRSGEITVERALRPQPGGGIWAWPLVRGLGTLADSLVLGTRALLRSAELAEADLGDRGSNPPEREGALVWTMLPSLLLAVGLFVVLPTALAGIWRRGLGSAVAAQFLEGAVRLLLLLGYVAGISAVGQVRRVLEYHGAEHKAIATLEAGLPLEVEAARGRSRFHPRCGTSFLLFVVLLAGFAFPLLGWQALWLRVLLRIILLPVVAALGYEVLRLSARGRAAAMRALVAPGLWLQHLTTREPDGAQLEVALAALRAALELPGTTEPPH